MLELLVVVSMLGLFAAGAMVRLGPETIWNNSAQGDARRLALSLQHARRLTIKTGDIHYVLLTPNAATPEGFQVMRSSGGVVSEADRYHAFAKGVTATSNNVGTLFNFEGQSLGSTVYTLSGPHRSFQVTVVPTTGAVQVSELD